MKSIGKYDDIINMTRHVSKKHPQMPLEARSAQFAPFAALTGFDEQIQETSRITKERIDINEELKEFLNEKLQKIQQKINTKPEITVTYFIPDLKKNGGDYVTVTGKTIKINETKQIIILEDKKEIPIRNIIEIVCNDL